MSTEVHTDTFALAKVLAPALTLGGFSQDESSKKEEKQNPPSALFSSGFSAVTLLLQPVYLCPKETSDGQTPPQYINVSVVTSHIETKIKGLH